MEAKRKRTINRPKIHIELNRRPCFRSLLTRKAKCAYTNIMIEGAKTKTTCCEHCHWYLRHRIIFTKDRIVKMERRTVRNV